MCRYFILLLLIRINDLRLNPSAVPARNSHAVSPFRQLLLRSCVLTLVTAALDIWQFPIQLIVFALILVVPTRRSSFCFACPHDVVVRFSTPNFAQLAHNMVETAERLLLPWLCLLWPQLPLQQMHQALRAGETKVSRCDVSRCVLLPSHRDAAALNLCFKGILPGICSAPARSFFSLFTWEQLLSRLFLEAIDITARVSWGLAI